MKNKEKEISIIITYIGLILGIIIYFFVTPYAIKGLGKEYFGIYNLVYTIVSYFTVLDFGFGDAIIRYTSKYLTLKDFKKLASINGLFIIIYLIIGIFSLLIGLLLINLSNNFFKALSTTELLTVKQMMKIALVNIVLSFPLSIFVSILKGYGKFILAEIIHVLKLLLSPLSILLGLFLGYKCVGIITIQTIINILVSLIPMIYCIFCLKIKFSKSSKDDICLIKEIFKFSFYVFLGLVVTKVFWSTDQLILGTFVGSFAVSICSLVSQIVQYYSSITETITKPYLSIITKKITLSKNKTIDFTDIFIKIGRIQFFLLLLIMSVFIIFGKEFIYLWAGEEFEQVYYLTLLILIPFTVPGIQNIGVAILQAMNIHKFRAILYFSIAIINVFISIYLVKKYGIYGTTFGTVIALTLGHIIIMNIYYNKKLKLNLKTFWSNMLLILIKMLPLLLFSFYFNKFLNVKISWLTFILKCFVYSILYMIILYKFIINSSEKEIFKNLIIIKKHTK